jgi:uncharacterized membrane protein
MLAGRGVIRGYPGWLWTHGIDTTQVDKDTVAIYSGLPNTEQLIEKYGIDYIYVGTEEKRNYYTNEEFFKATYSIFYQDDQTAIYQVNQ